jgi:hypothetical protein
LSGFKIDLIVLLPLFSLDITPEMMFLGSARFVVKLYAFFDEGELHAPFSRYFHDSHDPF